ncbi:outer membrane beta-barrel protein [Bacteroides sp. 51]|uniref:outer membrane beta-barrel protein n=1 Tax=Bacteroides sp. 51 TaxID=2302938 RepID=UPI0013D47CB7|nr:outer membrane beta-barrel protein [Bacteroides sp. 51]NDV81894.1 porin family protein [Bacteroides sp. 51]
MKKENDELTNLFRTRLEDAEMPLREGFWEELQQDIPIVISRRRQIIHRFSAAASVLLILAGASAAFWYFSPKEEIANAFTQVAVSTGTAGKMGADIVHGELPDFHASSTSPVPVASKPAEAIEEYDEEESFSVSFSMSFSISSSGNDNQNRTSNRYEERTAYAGGTEAAQPGSSGDEQQDALPLAKDKKHRTWSVGAFASAGLLSDRVHSQQIEPFTPTAISTLESGTIKHKQPFSVGLTVRKELSERWGIESGVVYTQLNSKLTTDEGGSYTQDQTLHYVGIPVKADLSLYKNKRVNLYASAGGMVEKCVSGDVKPNELQLSLTAAVGLQYKLSDRLSLYAEPGLSYHFDDGSPVHTIRKEKPLNMNLLCGIRMTY